jgi:hypothetical protein
VVERATQRLLREGGRGAAQTVSALEANA